jgi:GTP-binding protein
MEVDNTPVDDFKTINNELKSYSEKLASKKQIVIANKIDSITDEKLLKDLEKLCKKSDIKLFKVSAITKEGLDEVVEYLASELENIPKEELVIVEDYMEELPDQEWTIQKQGDEYKVTGAPIERLMSKVNVFDIESRQYMQRVLKNMGVMKKLIDAGLKEGDTIDIEGFKMEYFE